jgi:predicted nuclease of predicted toxin-antitoxin system
MSFLLGSPPKVVWIRIGNCTTSDIADLLRSQIGRIKAFLEEEEATFLILG